MHVQPTAPTAEQPRYTDVLAIQEKMTQVAERLSGLVGIVTKLTEVAQEGALAQKGALKLSEEMKTQLGDELSALASEINQMNAGIDHLLKGDEEIQELRELLKHRLPEGVEKLIKMNYELFQPIRHDSKIPLLSAMHEVLKLSRRSNCCDETTGEPLTGIRFLETKVVYALWTAIAAAIGVVILALLKKHLP